MTRKLMAFKVNGFILALILAVLIAFLFPEGAEVLSLNKATDIGIGLIFLFYGLKLSPANFKSGLTNFRLHLMIQAATFILFPVLVLAVRPLATGTVWSLLWTGVFFLATLPSTVSSSVVMVSIARGNVPAAIFNASLSGLIGLVATPIWLGLILNEVQNVSFSSVITKLVVQIVLPLSIGLLLHSRLGKSAQKNSKAIGNFDKTIIVLIVYSSFCRSFQNGLFSEIRFIDLVILLNGIWVLFLLVMLLLLKWSAAWNFTVPDRITALFCGSKKSLVHGSVMARIMFAGHPNASLFILPVMLYHISQILIISMIAEWIARRPEEKVPDPSS